MTTDSIRLMRAEASRAIGWARAHGLSGPPFCMELLASMLDLKIQHAELGDGREAALVGRTILVQRDVSAKRVRYSIAHEISHSFEAAQVLTREETSDLLEVACNIGAAELLMPMPAFHSHLSSRSVSLASTKELATRYAVSFEAAARRTVGMLKHRAGFLACQPPALDEDGIPWVASRDGVWPGALTVRVWHSNRPTPTSLKQQPVPTDSPIHRAWSLARAGRTRETQRRVWKWDAFGTDASCRTEAHVRPSRGQPREVVALCIWPGPDSADALMGVPELIDLDEVSEND